MADTSPSPLKKAPSPKLQKVGQAVLRFMAGHVMRVLVIMSAIGAVGYLLLTDVWQPLHEFIALPAGISSQNPQIDEAGLGVVNGQRAERAAHLPKTYTSIDKQFVPLPSPK